MTAVLCEGDTPPAFKRPRDYVKELKQYMNDHDISYGALARALGHEDSSQVSRWMNLRVEPRISSLLIIQKALDKIVKGRKN